MIQHVKTMFSPHVASWWELYPCFEGREGMKERVGDRSVPVASVFSLSVTPASNYISTNAKSAGLFTFLVQRSRDSYIYICLKSILNGKSRYRCSIVAVTNAFE
ncbi:hypothetical protein ATANTOWER_025205 [Ataeniobius toweri]|uniref:Uncharacterized protein n=1 Tax=Ataeniobius toweri TaxID=208326 RepID=A0ABU7BSF2_9TELE|nr:hypothetical protein [Ataeniobius toweri]